MRLSTYFSSGKTLLIYHQRRRTAESGAGVNSYGYQRQLSFENRQKLPVPLLQTPRLIHTKTNSQN
ncbi:hypothetical protein GQ600_8565 [Phytophthora cactorum]|nr:hypothetical protein GQ600_8565 [Phytophthora cactorum]